MSCITIYVALIERTDAKPSVKELKEIRNSDGLNAIQTIASNDYETFGMFLLNDDNGKGVDLIKEDVSGAVKITTEIIKTWLGSSGTPHTYRYLIQCVRKAGMGAFADHLESMMSTGHR